MTSTQNPIKMTTYLIRYSSLSVLWVQYFFSAAGNCDMARVDGAKKVKFFLESDR